jgi:hypothetical protein
VPKIIFAMRYIGVGSLPRVNTLLTQLDAAKILGRLLQQSAWYSLAVEKETSSLGDLLARPADELLVRSAPPSTAAAPLGNVLAKLDQFAAAVWATWHRDEIPSRGRDDAPVCDSKAV